MRGRKAAVAVVCLFLPLGAYGAPTGPSAVQGTDVPVTALSEPDATFPEAFSSVAGLRELSDGRVVVSDRLEQAVRVLDFDAGTMREIGRVGQGPGEYSMPGGLYALPADSTLLLDFANRRLTVIDPEGRLVRSMPSRHSSGTFIRPGGTDARGRVYFDLMGTVAVEEGPGGRSVSGLEDGAPLIRWDPASDAIDTLTFLARPSMRALRAGGGRPDVGRMAATTAFAKRDTWAVAADGRIAVVRAEPYRVEWLEPDGEEHVGPAVPYEPVPLTRADKEAWADRLAANAVVAIESVQNGRRSSRTMNVPRPDVDEIEFPETKPPFPAGAAAIGPNGALWVERHVGYGEPPTFDVFDMAGRRVRQVRLPRGRELVGFGADGLYAVRVDESGLQWLERYVTSRR